MSRAAETLDKTAELAEAHAQRRQEAGHPDGAAQERRAAERARNAAQRARAHAEELAERAHDGDTSR